MAASIVSLLHKDKIVPDLFPNEDGIDLHGRLDVMYPEHTVVPGEVIDRAVTSKQPHVRFQPFEGVQLDTEAQYTIMMLDLDDPSNTIPMRQSRHWMQTDVSLSSSTAPAMGGSADGVGSGEGLMARPQGPPLSEYLECAPGHGQRHRYVFILAQQSPSNPPDQDAKDRTGFEAAAYVSYKGMTVVGVSWMKVGSNSQDDA